MLLYPSHRPMIRVDYGVAHRRTLGRIRYRISAFLGPIGHDLPVGLENRMCLAHILQVAFQAGKTDQFLQSVREYLLRKRFVRHRVGLKLPCDAGFQSDFDGISKEVICVSVPMMGEQKFGIFQFFERQGLQLLSGDGCHFRLLTPPPAP
jgi:hypothetical protein